MESFKSAVGMKNPALSVKSVKKLPHGVYVVKISAQNSAAYIWIETPHSGHWSDNGFMWLLQKADNEEERTLLFHSENIHLSEEELQSSIKLRSLWDTAEY